jgi:hypothetical protein
MELTAVRRAVSRSLLGLFGQSQKVNSANFALTGFSEVALLGSYPAAERGGPFAFGKVILHLREKSDLRRNYDG